MNRSIISIPATMLLDLIKQAAAISGRPFPADMRFVTLTYTPETEEVRLVVESERFCRVPLGGHPEVVFSPFDGGGRHW